MKEIKRSFFGQVRAIAFACWKGPRFVRKMDDDNPSGGLCVLRLAIRKETSVHPMIEARAVYGSVVGDDLFDAILRAIYWDSQTVVRKSSPEITAIQIPARFVQLPIAQVQHWIGSLDMLQTSIKAYSQEDDSLPICTLRVETDYTSSVFEKTWQVVEGEESELNRAWKAIWQEMGVALETSPPITFVEESFPSVELPADVYDFQTYQPTLNVP